MIASPHSRDEDVRRSVVASRLLEGSCFGNVGNNGCRRRNHNRVVESTICPFCNTTIRNDCCTDTIDRHWNLMPPSVKNFILGQGKRLRDENGVIGMGGLVEFWSSVDNVGLTGRGDVSGACWHLALLYLRLGFLQEAKALTINASFLQQCISSSSIDHVKQLCNTPTVSQQSILQEWAICTEGFFSTHSVEKMESYIRRYVPSDNYQQRDEQPQSSGTSYTNLSSRNGGIGRINQISDDINYKKQIDKHFQACRGTQIQLVFVDEGEIAPSTSAHHVFDVLSSTTLKEVFIKYATKRGVSLRSLRFSFDGKPLFLSQFGKKTPEELGMQVQAVIVVHDTNKNMSQLQQQAPKKESSTRGVCQNDIASSSSTSNRTGHTRRVHSSKRKKQKGRSAGGKGLAKHRQEPIKAERTQEELKIEHSKMLTRIHEELQPRLKRIRQRLNNLLIERTQRKTKSSSRNNSKVLPAQAWSDISCVQCLRGGKAGRSFFDVHVGEIGNLYKTSRKLSHQSLATNTPTTLDLHGYTSNDALAKLDESLEVWVECAMRGSYPFVIQVKIVCGCGGQVLSEVVQGWIKEKRNVSNVPKKR